mmetsp:Transcript_8891/g.29252  ORF Transcript_8891/g.29252 Transcript_8891/m.29252 type:complete len:338 (-) Transcript_8891:180-1193(-)
MEGKAVLFKVYADLDAYDICLSVPSAETERLVDTIAALEPTFGAINLEDIASPECFIVERELRKRCSIPVLHDDAHGTAVVAGAALLNALKLADKRAAEARVVVCGVGAAGFACARFFVDALGVRPSNLLAVDLGGVVHTGRADLQDEASPMSFLREVAQATPKRTLAEAVAGADVFCGVSAGGVLKPELLASMSRDPIVFALANPDPEIDPSLAKEVRQDVIIATGRSDYANQVNNCLCFPYLFRGALDCRASTINEEMKLAAAHELALLAQESVDGGDEFSREYLIPKPGDSRLLERISAAVADAASESGVARAPLASDAYRWRLQDESRRASLP